jgi:hypothetical protein
LYTEEDVDNLISYLPDLEYLNNLSVERSERQLSDISQTTKQLGLTQGLSYSKISEPKSVSNNTPDQGISAHEFQTWLS